MQRRRFLGLAGLSALGLAASGSYAVLSPNSRPTPSVSLTENQLRLFGSAFGRSTRVFVIADTHLWQSDDREIPFRQYSERMAAAYHQTTHFKTGLATQPMQGFEYALAQAVEQKPDLLILAGDIFSYPSEAAIEWALERLNSIGIPYVYVAGNHDWHYEGMEGSPMQLRQVWSEKRLKPLYQGDDPLMSRRDVNGIRFICIDDSTGEILPEQLAFFTRHARFDGPVVLVAHIPLYVPGRPVTFSCGHPEWGTATDTLHTLERRQPWPEAHTQVTMDFHREVFSTPNVVAILAGHIHTPSIDVFKGVVQAVAPPNLAGGFLDVTFDPA